MKNKKMEQYKISAKHYAKHWQKQLNQDGNHLPHAYPENERKKLAWWDDVFFKLGSQVVAIWWVHPRQHYADLCENLLDKQINMPDTASCFEWGEKIYTQVGKSRKKIKYYQTSSRYNDERWQLYFAQREQLRQNLLYENDLLVKPFMQIQQYAWGLGVNLCLPIEALDEMSVNEMAQIAKRLVRRETTLAKLYPDYTYSKTDWQRENLFQAA